MDRQIPPNVSFLSGRDTAPAYWMYNILWVPLIEGHQTGGSFSVIEQWMRKDSGALMPHVHNFCDEWFYMIDGMIEFTVSGEKLLAKARFAHCDFPLVASVGCSGPGHCAPHRA